MEKSQQQRVDSSVNVHFFFSIRDAFIRDEMMSTENFGKIRDGEYSNFSRYKG